MNTQHSVTNCILNNFDHECFHCKQDIDLYNDQWEIAWDSSEQKKEVLYHPNCLDLAGEEDNRNPDEPNIFVEHKI